MKLNRIVLSVVAVLVVFGTGFILGHSKNSKINPPDVANQTDTKNTPAAAQTAAQNPLSQNQTFTEETMLRIARETVLQGYRDWYNVKNEQEVSRWVQDHFTEPDKFIDGFKKQLPTKAESGIVTATNETVEYTEENSTPYIIYRASINFLETINGKQQPQETYKQIVILQPDNKKFKIAYVSYAQAGGNYENQRKN